MQFSIDFLARLALHPTEYTEVQSSDIMRMGIKIAVTDEQQKCFLEDYRHIYKQK